MKIASQQVCLLLFVCYSQIDRDDDRDEDEDVNMLELQMSAF